MNIKALGHVVLDKCICCFPNIGLCKSCDPQPQGHELNSICRGLLGSATNTRINDLGLMFSD